MSEAPAFLPLFPLGTVLFPGGLLPLRIFELRYLQMISECHKTGTPFGVVGLVRGAEVRAAGASPETFADMGTLATIRQLESPQSGLLVIECVGTERFRVLERRQQTNGLWTARTETLPAEPRVPVPDDLHNVADALRQFADTLRQRGGPLPMAEPFDYDDCGWVANRWCELLPLPSEMRQRMLALDSPLVRLELVGDLLAQTRISGQR
ncbi:LON peptidase substrate-binding domain-containing protein [uncultured Pseudacidovorax sp.]|uniref:LON peptidase substrate-binding domain-containing protein n=1 Tax=uncultured Pseudacidovorax sp. TaxID=679313 RepID=UPI0025CD0505|nr:LON peptidase substrate-binding domain-containing protein [uncultured Pseudacidovorax sp.]